MDNFQVKRILRNLLIFCVGFTMYQCMEGVWKNIPTLPECFYGAESFTMGLLGGLSILIIGSLNEKLPWSMPIWFQAIIGCIVITTFEFIVGCALNLWLCPLLGKPIIWSYESLPGNFIGQICPQFSFLWFLLSFVAIFVDDFLRWKVFDDEKPHYTFWWKK